MSELLDWLAKAYLGESQARNRYTKYAKIAQQEGYEQIAAIYLQTADHERVHGLKYFDMFQEVKKKLGKSLDDYALDGIAVPNVMNTTAENLEAAIAGEHFENSELYPMIADVAKKEGYSVFAARIRSIAKAEEHHEARYKKLLEQVKAGTVLQKSKKVWWYCRHCGYWHYGEKPPEKCPSCDHPKSYFQVLSEEY